MAGVAAVGSLVLGGISVMQQRSAGAQANDIAQEQAMRDLAVSNEVATRTERSNKAAEAESKARAAASGLTLEGTPGAYLEELESIGREEVDWIRAAGASDAALTLSSGRSTQRAANAASLGTLADTGRSFYSLGSAANWWS